MKRGGFLRRKTPLKRKKGLRYMSNMQRKRIKSYLPIQKAFLAEHKFCEICKVRKMLGDPAIKRIRRSVEVHHSAGRPGKFLFDDTYFIASCRPCRMFPHNNPKIARKHGLLI